MCAVVGVLIKYIYKIHGATIKIHVAHFYRGGDIKVSLIRLSYTAWTGFKTGRARGYKPVQLRSSI